MEPAAPSQGKRWSTRSMALVAAALFAGIFVMVLALVSLGTATGFLTHLAAEPLGPAPHLETARASSESVVAAGNPRPTANVATAAPAADTTAAPQPTPVAVPVAIAAVSGGTGGAAPTPSAATPVDLGGGGGASNGGSSGNAGFGGALGSEAVSPAVAVLQLLNMGASQACGNNTCNVGLVCCNRSCGTCAPPDASCDQAECDNAPTFPAAIPCGLSTCSQGQVCCNQSCGLCAAPGEVCSQRICS